MATGTGELQGTVLIVLDTVRADHLSCYGHSRPTTPNIDELAKGGVRFSQVVAPAPWTLPSMAGLLSGEYPGRRFMNGKILDRSLVEELAAAGMVTAAITEGGSFPRAFKLDLGFEFFVEEEGPIQEVLSGQHSNPDTKSGIEGTFRQAREWLADNRGESFFLLVHTYEAHTPYTRRTYAEGMYPGRMGNNVTLAFLKDQSEGRVTVDEAETEYIKAMYDGGVHHADRHVGELVAFLKEVGIADRTLVVVTSDHREELGDQYRNRTAAHGHSQRDPLLMVPLVIYDPANTYPLMMGEESEGRPALSAHTNHGPLRAAIRDDEIKYIKIIGRPDSKKLSEVKPRPSRHQLYDLKADPGEKNDLAETHPERPRALRKVLEGTMAGLTVDQELEALEITDPVLLERLKSLGYVE